MNSLCDWAGHANEYIRTNYKVYLVQLLWVQDRPWHLRSIIQTTDYRIFMAHFADMKCIISQKLNRLKCSAL